ncbi:MAG TPA: type II toxin-antitoxin system VapC family toxin [Candidatus Thermoplasmatota archaeon]|nr:type II toxin-antitoxin system VapC family toxin [Candidatus Thermoplasmatota archaeon]
MIYLDSNVFIYAGTDGGARGRAAASLLAKTIRDGACTASLTADEVLWAIAKKLGRPVAAEKVRQFLALNLEVVGVEKRDIESALRHFENGLDPRDAIHAAVAIRKGCSAIASSDPAFANLEGLHHLTY